MEPVVLLDAAGRRRSVTTMPGHRRGQAPRNEGMRYPADPPSVEEIVLVRRYAGDRAHGLRLRGLIVVMWRAGLRIGEALALTKSDLDEARRDPREPRCAPQSRSPSRGDHADSPLGSVASPDGRHRVFRRVRDDI
jgi:hypothetical protein